MTTRGWLLGCIPFGFALAVLHRPLRDQNFFDGLAMLWRPVLWLFYLEGLLPPPAPMNSEPLQALGFMVGLFMIAFLLVAILRGFLWLCSRPQRKPAEPAR